MDSATHCVLKTVISEAQLPLMRLSQSQIHCNHVGHAVAALKVELRHMPQATVITAYIVWAASSQPPSGLPPYGTTIHMLRQHPLLSTAAQYRDSDDTRKTPQQGHVNTSL